MHCTFMIMYMSIVVQNLCFARIIIILLLLSWMPVSYLHDCDCSVSLDSGKERASEEVLPTTAEKV